MPSKRKSEVGLQSELSQSKSKLVQKASEITSKKRSFSSFVQPPNPLTENNEEMADLEQTPELESKKSKKLKETIYNLSFGEKENASPQDKIEVQKASFG